MPKLSSFSFQKVAPCLFAIFIDVMGMGLIAPLLVLFFTDPAYNIFEIDSTALRYFYLGLSLALYPFLMFFGTAFIGDLSDNIGRKKTLFFSMVGMVLGFVCMGLGIVNKDIFLFLLGRGLSGVVSASQAVALATISDLSTPDNKVMHLSYVSLIECLGFVLGPLLGGVLSEVQLYLPLFGAAVLAFLACVWIQKGFAETFIPKKEKKISFSRFLKVFVQAYQEERIRKLCLVFFMMQIGISFYLPIILIHLNQLFHYTPFSLGMFNGYLGLCFCLGLVVVLPKLLRRFSIERIVGICLVATFVLQFFSSLLTSQFGLWLLAFPLAVGAEIAFSGMFSAFSNAADENSQGWVMGISVAIISIAWAFTAFFTLFLPLCGAQVLIFGGSLFLGMSGYLMRKYNAQYHQAQVT